MPVDSTHKQYNAAANRWDLVRSVVANNASKFIRTVDPLDHGRSEQYRESAILTNFTGLTKVGLTGLVFRKPSTARLPRELEYLKEDATGGDLPLEQMAHFIVGELLETGRHGILVDYPPVPEGLSKQQLQEEQYAARLKSYAAESIINWRVKEIGSRVVLDLVVLKEMVDEIGEDGFQWEEKVQYRVLRLDEEGHYIQQVFDEDQMLLSFSKPMKLNSKPFDYIPFTFIGSQNNDADVDKIPLYDLAVINIGHYRNSADLEESGYVCGQPTLFLSADLDQETFKSMNPNGVRFGSRQGIFLGPTGAAQLLQANPNQLISQMMLEKRNYAVELGARIISLPGGRETAEAARIRFGSQNSALGTLTANIGTAIEQCLKWTTEFMGGNPDSIDYELNDQFYEENADPAIIAQELMVFDRSLMTTEEFRNNRRLDGTLDPDSVDDGIIAVQHVQDPLAGVGEELADDDS